MPRIPVKNDSLDDNAQIVRNVSDFDIFWQFLTILQRLDHQVVCDVDDCIGVNVGIHGRILVDEEIVYEFIAGIFQIPSIPCVKFN